MNENIRIPTTPNGSDQYLSLKIEQDFDFIEILSLNISQDKVYETYNIFSQHVKTKAHQKWLQGLNLNKANYYIENEELKIIIQQQRMVIAKLEKDLQNKIMTIDFLTQQLVAKSNQKPVSDLLDFD